MKGRRKDGEKGIMGGSVRSGKMGRSRRREEGCKEGKEESEVGWKSGSWGKWGVKGMSK